MSRSRLHAAAAEKAALDTLIEPPEVHELAFVGRRRSTGDLSGTVNVNFSLIGGTSLLIIVGVAIETMQAIEAQLLMRNYEGFLGKGMAPLRGRSG